MGAFDAYNTIEESTSWGSSDAGAVWPWWAFVREKWIPRPSSLAIDAEPDYELEQRKRLVKEWMDAGQVFRDAYVARVSSLSPIEADSLRQGLCTNGSHEIDNPRYIPSKYPLILAHPPSSQSTHAAWARLVFLTRYDSMATCWEEPAPHYTPSSNMSTPDIDPGTFATAYLPFYCPNFDLLGLDSHGCPYIYRQLYQFVDAQGLQEGSKVVTEYASDGTIARGRRLAAYFGKNDENKVCSMGHGWIDVVEEYEWDLEHDGIDVHRLGITALIVQAMAAQGLDPNEYEDEIRSNVQTFAPELLE